MSIHKNSYIQIRIDKLTKEKFITMCNKNGYSTSKLIRNFIKEKLSEQINN